MKKELCVKLVIFQDYNEMHGQKTQLFFIDTINSPDDGQMAVRNM